LRGCAKTCRLIPQAKPATEDDYRTEFLDLILSVKIVSGLEEAVEHIARYGSQHTETIVTGDRDAAQRFTTAVGSASVQVQGRTRFNDGVEVGLGTGIRVRTHKLHVR